MKILLSTIYALITMAAVTANATTFTEEYTGDQLVSGGSAYYFEFDLWYTNPNNIKTNSSLTLSQDASGAFDPWNSAFLYVDLYSTDANKDKAKITLQAYDALDGSQSGTIYNLGTYKFGNANSGGVLNLAYQFDSTILDNFDNNGWGKVRIRAIDLVNFDTNFSITRVALEANTGVAPVPEPSTILLMGAGLASLVGYNRKRKMLS